ncbi:hypothetical protein D9M72_560900 [compost metagenome]
MQQPHRKIIAFHERAALERNRPLRVGLGLILRGCELAARGLLDRLEEVMIDDAGGAQP